MSLASQVFCFLIVYCQLLSARSNGDGVKANDLNATLVFEPNLASVACYRIPSIVQSNKGTLIAFAEARHGSCSDSAVHEIAVRRSTDSGATWGSVISAVGNDTYFVGNPTSLFTHSGKVMLIYVKHSPHCSGDCGTGNALVTSSDDGLTWSNPQDISEMFGAASGSLPGPGVALQLDSGRILVPSHHSAYVHDFVSYSDNDGLTWTTINQTFPKMDEAQMTQLPNGSILLNMRHQNSRTEGRAGAISLDGGLSFGNIFYDHTLISPVCQASILTINNATFFSNPASTSGRNHITIRKSVDNGKSWPNELLVLNEDSAGYSCLTKINELNNNGDVIDHTGGILFEGPGSTIKFAKFPLEF